MKTNFSVTIENSILIRQILTNKSTSLNNLANCIRFLSIDAVEKAKSGHPGMPMGMADIATVLYKNFLKFDPDDPNWPDRDRLILSNGHGSMLLYSCLYLTGYKKITLNQLRNFRQLKSLTPGHPEYSVNSGIETTTGPLAQGFANAVGMALSERFLNSKFGNSFVDHYTYVFAGDGCLMEGLSHEAASLAGHLKLNKLIIFFDDNKISIDGSTKLSVSDNHLKRFAAQGWNTISINGHNHGEISNAIKSCKKSKKPSIIACKTKIGFGSPNKESSSASHGSPLGKNEIQLTRDNLNWNSKPFAIPKKLILEWRNFATKNKIIRKSWLKRIKKSKKRKEFLNYINTSLPIKKLNKKIINFKISIDKNSSNYATRKASEMSLEIIKKEIDFLIGGSADLTGSNNTKTKSMKIISKDKYDGDYIHYGVREHAMAAIMSGMSLHKGVIPYGGTFLVFTDYCRPSIRLAALMGIQVIYVMSHDSIGLGEDGPTHQPIEHLAALRAIPNLDVYRPADIIETIECWENALLNKKNPSVLVLTRQNLPIVRKNNLRKNMVNKGAYIIKNFTKYDATIIATGSEVSLAIEASNFLEKRKIKARVISMTCWELFDKQTKKYKNNIIGNKNCYAVEAASSMGWSKYVPVENFLGMNSFGASGPYKELYNYFGITVNNLIKLITKKN